MCQHPTHQVNVSRRGVLCAPDSSKCFETPCITKQVMNSSTSGYTFIDKHNEILNSLGLL